jgi:cyanophycinase
MVDARLRQVRLMFMKPLLPLVVLFVLLSQGPFATERVAPEVAAAQAGRQGAQGREVGNAPPKGKLVIVGGGGTTDGIFARALELAGGKDARMLIVPQASGDAEESGESSRKHWSEKGVRNISVLDHKDEKGALRAIERADLIWISGGDQSRLAERLGKTALPAAMRKRYQEGAVVGGTSAGAAIMSQRMLVGGDKADLDTIRSGGSQTSEGFGLWPEAIIDQHFVARQRFTRLLTCVLDNPDFVGIGIDERTAVLVDGARCEVLGESSVLVIDARAAQKRPSKSGETLSASDLKLHVLHAGDTFEIAARAQ